MKQSQFSQEQIIRILQAAEQNNRPITQICREAGTVETIFCRWRKHYAGMSVPDAQRL